MSLFLTECPRDAMQGWGVWIPTEQKIDYLNALLAVGYDTLDAGSFVSPKAVPQMADTDLVLNGIDRSISNTKISVIVANISGAEKAIEHKNVDILGFPFSISETFQFRNTNKSQEIAFSQIREIKKLTDESGKNLHLYFSMAFGNPYGESWSWKDVDYWAEKFSDIGVDYILLSDTTGVATANSISLLFQKIPEKFQNITFAAHLHNRPEDSLSKLKAAYNSGCRHFDSAILGIGGCPFAKDDLLGNMPTEQVFNFMNAEKIPIRQNILHFESAWNLAKSIFKAH